MHHFQSTKEFTYRFHIRSLAVSIQFEWQYSQSSSQISLLNWTSRYQDWKLPINILKDPIPDQEWGSSRCIDKSKLSSSSKFFYHFCNNSWCARTSREWYWVEFSNHVKSIEDTLTCIGQALSVVRTSKRSWRQTMILIHILHFHLRI